MSGKLQTEKFMLERQMVPVDAVLPPIGIGAAKIMQVPEIAFRMPISMLTSDQALLDENASWLKPLFLDDRNDWDMVVQSWLVVVDGRVVLVDPCTGNGRINTALAMQHMLDTPYIERFGATGVRPEDVDYVFCTHLHADHCGWNTQLRDGAFVPTFPNARYLMVRREFDRWDVRRPDRVYVPANMGAFENSVLPVLERGLVDLVADEHRISKSLFIEPAYGHTLGHSLMHLVSGAREAYFAGDSFHHPLEIKYPELDMGACEDFPTSLATRRRIIRNCIDRGALFVSAHFAAPHVGWVKSVNGQSVFEPYQFG